MSLGGSFSPPAPRGRSRRRWGAPPTAWPHFCLLRLERRESLALLPSNAVHLLIKQLHQVANVALRENMIPQLLDNQPLKPIRIEPRSLAARAAAVQNRLADVVAVPAALRFGSGQRPATESAANQLAQQVATGRLPRVDTLRRA